MNKAGRPRIRLTLRDYEWRLPCGCAFHYFHGLPDVDKPVHGQRLLLGIVSPHVHPCSKHEKEWSK